MYKGIAAQHDELSLAAWMLNEKLSKDTNRQINRTLRVLWQGTMSAFLARHYCPSICHCSSNKATDPIFIALSSSQYAKDYSELFYEDLFSPEKSGPELRSQLLLIVAGDPHMSEHQEPFSTPLSSADGRPPMASCFYNTAHVTLRGERARAAASLACSGRRNMLSAAFICIVLSASAGPLPGSRRRKDNNALSSPYF